MNNWVKGLMFAGLFFIGVFLLSYIPIDIKTTDRELSKVLARLTLNILSLYIGYKLVGKIFNKKNEDIK